MYKRQPNKLIIYDKNFDKTGEVDLSKFIAELNASGESLLIYNGSNITMDTAVSYTHLDVYKRQ